MGIHACASGATGPRRGIVRTPQPGDYGCTPLSDDAGKLIRLGQWLNGDGFRDYEHAFVWTDGGMIVEAEPGGAVEVPFHYDLAQCVISSEPLTGVERAAIVRAARGYIGTPYSVADYFALAAHRLHIPAPGLRAYVGSTRHQICSQLVDRCFLDAGVHLFQDSRWPGYCTPADLAALALR